MKKQTLILLLALGMVFPLGLLSPISVMGQQDAHYSQYIFNGLVLNPAYAGSRGTFSTMLFLRKQWVGLPGAPATGALSLHTPIGDQRSNFGLTISDDIIGYTNQLWMHGSYAFRFPLGPGKMAFGIQGGLLNYRIDWSKAETVDQDDVIIGNTAQNRLIPNVGAGIFYNTATWYAGVSMPHILDTELRPLDGTIDDFAQLYRHYFFTAGIVLWPQSTVKFKPSVLVKYVSGAPLQADFNASFLINDFVWVGASYRTLDAAVFMVDFQLTKQLRLGYAFDWTLSELGNYNTGSHELMIGYDFYFNSSQLKSPRYF